MESGSHSLRLPLPTPRRPMHRRTASSSSEASHASNTSHRSDGSEDQFVLSPNQTPAHEKPPPRIMASRYATDTSAARNGLLLGKEIYTRPRDTTLKKTPSFFRLAPSSESKPIAIDLPGTRRAEPVSAFSSSSPEPLSARGDVPGGYFPLHEDPDSRLRSPQPFHPQTDMARQGSLHRAAESSKSGSEPRPLSPAHASMSNSASVSSSVNTPISSYNPSGLHDDVVLPMGKYYPSNWEKRHGKSPQTRPSTQPTSAPVTMRSEPQVPKYHGNDQAHPRPGSDIKRRLQQYQRDMVAQAAMAANALIASSSGSASPATTTTTTSPLGSGGAATLPKAQLAATFFKTHKPLSPRLRPVGSPGPVTPMSLEADCYLALGSPVGGGLEAEFSGMETGDGVRAGAKGKQRRKDSRSEPTELSAASI